MDAHDPPVSCWARCRKTRSDGGSPTASASSFGSQSIVNLKGETRGVPFCDVLSRCGARLQNCDPSAKNFEVSVVSPRLHEFISHNWSLPRREKFLVLALRYNFLNSMVLLVVAWIVCVVLTALGYLPVVTHHFADHSDREMGCFCTILPVVLFLPSLFVLHDIVPRKATKLVFLDKCCIHQVDMKRQRMAILNLAAFIWSSDKFLTVYSEDYLRKLWTIYEFACFLMMRGSANVTILPSFMPWFVVVGVSGWSLYNALVYLCVQVLAARGVMSSAASVASYVPLLPVLSWPFLGRRWARQLQSASMQASTFTIKKAACTNDSDRPILERNIAQLVRERMLVEEHAPHWQAMRAFDQHVRENFPIALRSSVGPVMLQYRYAVAVGTSSIGYGLDVLGAQLRQGPLEPILWLFLIERLCVGLFFVPLFTGSCLVATKHMLHLSGWQDTAFAYFCAGSVLGVCYALYRLDNSLLVPASQSTTMLILKLSLEIAVVCITAILYFFHFDSTGMPTRSKCSILKALPQSPNQSSQSAPTVFVDRVPSAAPPDDCNLDQDLVLTTI